MAAFQKIWGLEGLGREVDRARRDQANLRVSGGSESCIELSLARLLAGGASHQLIVVLPAAPAKVVLSWTHSFEGFVRGLGPAEAEKIEVRLLPAISYWGADRYAVQSAQREQRMRALGLMAIGEAKSIIVTTLPALAQRTVNPQVLRSRTLEVARGSTDLPMDSLLAALSDLGYGEAVVADDPGTYSVRGGLLDVFPSHALKPVRIEYLGNSIDSVRVFDPETQRSLQELLRVRLLSAHEVAIPRAEREAMSQHVYSLLVDRDRSPADCAGVVRGIADGTAPTPILGALGPAIWAGGGSCGLDYLAADAYVVFPMGFAAAAATGAEWMARAREQSLTSEKNSSSLALTPEEHFVDLEEVGSRLCGMRGRVLDFSALGAGTSQAEGGGERWVHWEGRATVDGAPLGEKAGVERLDQWTDVFRRTLTRGEGGVAVLCVDRDPEELIETFRHRSFDVQNRPALARDVALSQLDAGRIYVGRGEVRQHAWLEESRLLVLSDRHLLGASRVTAEPASKKLQNYLNSFRELKVGDLVVHMQHGIGRYCGLTRLEIGELSQDYLIVEYAGADRIYVPVDTLSLLQRYTASGEGVQPSLDRLKSQSWEKRKARVRKAVRDIADQLVKLSARRKLARAPMMGPRAELYESFERGFPYQETDDQLRAIEEVHRDLDRPEPMDRLVCGDVGFGKTEVALRAVFRVVSSGYQAMVLVPTTVLCFQHFRTFVDRLGPHGVSVAAMNRFCSTKDLQQTLQRLARGEVDVVVGTHRLLSKDVTASRLGLLVIDEEQRFGVVHKERIKEMRAGVHVLTMTATPIPRTLHMAMVGLRDISIIGTAPPNRMPVRTFVASFDEDLVRDAIEQELHRGGQVFFVHNRIDDIMQVAQMIATLVPQARVRWAHGQLPEAELERVILDFIDQKFDVLVCTTIIESGVDMPNVNTLIVHHADRFGLAQLYQLRGRVGRSGVQAHAYFLTEAGKVVGEEGRQRLEVLASFQDLGSGFQIASYDLEMRGAGDLLGGDQSGHVGEVGLELYTDMLERAVQDLRGEVVREVVDPEVKLPVTVGIPDTYVQRENERLHYYKSIFSARDRSRVAELRDGMRDRYGEMPLEVQRLFELAELKQTLMECGVRSLALTPQGRLEYRFVDLSAESVNRLVALVQSQPRIYEVGADGRLLVGARQAELVLRSGDDVRDEVWVSEGSANIGAIDRRTRDLARAAGIATEGVGGT